MPEVRTTILGLRGGWTMVLLAERAAVDMRRRQVAKARKYALMALRGRSAATPRYSDSISAAACAT
jgi:hypothetical protein